MAKIVCFPHPRVRSRDATGLSERQGSSYTQVKVSNRIETAEYIEPQFRIGDWVALPSLNRLARDGEQVQLELKAMDVLLCLASRPGEVVTKHELVDAVWQTEFVSDNTLTRRIAELREALGDDARNPTYIETITKRGYRLLAEVESVVGDQPDRPGGLDPAAAEPASPYPGLAAFTEDDADVFFGREAETANLWRRIAGRRLLAVVGPSGAGKSSLLRAGIVARAPPGWRAVVCHPGDEPFLALARALAPDLAGDTDELHQLLAFHDPDIALTVTARWRGRWDEVLVVVDQFEELFTLTPESIREGFVDLLRRLVDAAGIHVVLVLRDDFLIECQRYPRLAPIFGELTPVGAPDGRSLRRAVTEPAARRGFAFEDETLVDEMVSLVEDERGALPLLAFAMARMWELRDLDRRMLTREAYDSIGGVGGALAQHAEATVEAIGFEHLSVVRELFRHLVTAQGTRAVLRVDDLLSVFDEHEVATARRVLGALIDGRLVTSFEGTELPDRRSGTGQRIEIVHEALLRSWPRLVRWRTRDADAAQLRDQLRQAAKLWDARERPRDLLWTGSSFREFRLWQEQYPGGLSSTEKAFADAMMRLAARRRRWRRVTVGTAALLLVATTAVITGLWRSSERNARRAEAGRLYQLGKQWLEPSPPMALAYAIASLEQADDAIVRRLAMQALADGPMPMAVDRERLSGLPVTVTFSPDGSWFAAGTFEGGVALWRRSGSGPVVWPAASMQTVVWASPDSRVLVTGGSGDTEMTFWRVADGGRLGSVARRDGIAPGIMEGRAGNNLIRLKRIVSKPTGPGGWTIDPAPVAAWRRLAQVAPRLAVSPDGRRLLVADGAELVEIPVGDHDSVPRLLGRAPAVVEHIAFHPDGWTFATWDIAGSARIWSRTDSGLLELTSFRGPADDVCDDLRFDPSGRFIAAVFDGSYCLVWGLDDPPDAAPIRLAPNADRMPQVAFHPDGSWLATASLLRVAVWPFERSRYPFVLHGHSGRVGDVEFSADGRAIISSSDDGTVRRWPVQGSGADRPSILLDWGHTIEGGVSSSDVSGDGRLVVSTGGESDVRVLADGGGSERRFGGFDTRVLRAALSTDGRKLAVPGLVNGRSVIRVWDVGSGAGSTLDLRELEIDANGIVDLDFTADGDLLVADSRVLAQWDSATDAPKVLASGVGDFAASRYGSILVARAQLDWPGDDHATVYDLRSGVERRLISHGVGVVSVAVDPTGAVVLTGNRDGFIRVGPADGGPPQHIMSNQGVVLALAVSPDGRWIASGGSDGTVRLWSMPDLDRPSVLSLPHDDFLAYLEAQTNLRVVDDDADADGSVKAIGDTLVWQ